MSVGAVVSLGVIGVVAGIALAVAARKLAVEVDPREAEINEVLPGANCGACGHPGCSGYAAAVVAVQPESTNARLAAILLQHGLRR